MLNTVKEKQVDVELVGKGYQMAAHLRTLERVNNVSTNISESEARGFVWRTDSCRILPTSLPNSSHLAVEVAWPTLLKTSKSSLLAPKKLIPTACLE
jgi:hypothetical protein